MRRNAHSQLKRNHSWDYFVLCLKLDFIQTAQAANANCEFEFEFVQVFMRFRKAKRIKPHTKFVCCFQNNGTHAYFVWASAWRISIADRSYHSPYLLALTNANTILIWPNFSPSSTHYSRSIWSSFRYCCSMVWPRRKQSLRPTGRPIVQLHCRN